MSKRKVCVVIASRANYGRIKSVLQEIKNHEDLELQVVASASALLFRFGKVVDIMEEDGFAPDAKVHIVIEGDSLTTMAKSTGLAVIEMAGIFDVLKPDIVLTVADRYETLATSIAASYMNIPVAHTQGGEVTGSIDESVRHATTKLSHFHFVTTELSKKRVIQMGENPDRVYLTGCPSIDLIANLDLSADNSILTKRGGVGSHIDLGQDYLVVLQHPVTTEYKSASSQITETIQAIKNLAMQTIWIWPNVDAGSDDISKELRKFREQENPQWLYFHRNFEPEDYARIIKNCSCLIGNSSSALREGAFLGVPSVDIGIRQHLRECGQNVINTPYDAVQIEAAIRKQLAHGPYPKDPLFGDGNASVKIAHYLAKEPIGTVQKEFFDL